MFEDTYYKITIERNGKTFIFGGEAVNNSVSIDINEEPKDSIFEADITIYNISDETKQHLSYTNIATPMSKIIIDVCYNGIFSRIFTGIIRDIQKEAVEETATRNLLINACSFDLKNKLFSISCKKNNTNFILKKMFANAMMLTLKSNTLEEDKEIRKTNYYYSGNSPLIELRNLFNQQEIFISNGFLCFEKKQNIIKQDKGNVVLLKNCLLSNIEAVAERQIEATFYFNPTLKCGEWVKIENSDEENKDYNGLYFIRALRHNFTYDTSEGLSAYTFLLLENNKLVIRI